MRESAEKINMGEKPTSNYDLIIETIERALIMMPPNENRRIYLISSLSKDYGRSLAEKMVNSVSDRFLMEVQTKIDRARNNIKVRRTRTTAAITTPIALASIVGVSHFLNNKEESPKIDKELPKQETTVGDNKSKEDKTISFDQRFKGEVYSSLPEQGKEVYKYFAENNPTPGRCYEFLDKESALIYIFSKDNELIAKIPTGFGKNPGDEPNTSAEYNKGKMTSPAGVYLISNSVNEADIEEYGKLQYSLFGVSVKGDNVFLGQHQTYSKHGELEPRTEKLESETAEDNNFSNGCLNNKEEDIKKYVMPNFKGDNAELLFILQDKEGKKDGKTFNVKTLVQKIIPVMLEMAGKEEKAYEESMTQIRDVINKEWENIAILQNEQNDLILRYNKNKENFKLQDKINENKEIIKLRKNLIGENRRQLGVYDLKMKELAIKRVGIEKILNQNN